ncbi:MAG TPA: hypothetical protein VK132_06290, partial [Gemmatimonadales bacterium]|nr:hypothetical protein [Gemmatimonadales bacterium]
ERNAASIGRKITPCLGPSKASLLVAVILLLLTLQGIPSVALTGTLHSPRVKESSLAGADRGFVRIRGARAVDWEDIALGPCLTQPGACLFIADTGDNEMARKSVVIYAVAEPDPPGRRSGPVRSGHEAAPQVRRRPGRRGGDLRLTTRQRTLPREQGT